jgi:hypothetical protein
LISTPHAPSRNLVQPSEGGGIAWWWWVVVVIAPTMKTWKETYFYLCFAFSSVARFIVNPTLFS